MQNLFAGEKKASGKVGRLLGGDGEATRSGRCFFSGVFVRDCGAVEIDTTAYAVTAEIGEIPRNRLALEHIATPFLRSLP